MTKHTLRKEPSFGRIDPWHLYEGAPTGGPIFDVWIPTQGRVNDCEYIEMGWTQRITGQRLDGVTHWKSRLSGPFHGCRDDWQTPGKSGPKTRHRAIAMKQPPFPHRKEK